MVSLPAILAFVPVAALIVAVPGPSVLFTIGRALAAGRRSALLTVLGNGAGIAVQVGLITIGLAAVVAAASGALLTLKLFGGAYLIWLGVSAIRGRRDAGEESATVAGGRSTLVDLRSGFIVGVTNPKTVVFLTALLPQFVPGPVNAAAQMALLGLTFVALAILGDSVWALAAARARSWFGRSRSRLTGIRTAGGVMLVGLGTYTIVAGNRPT